MIKAGDLVKVKNWGKGYTTYTGWFLNNFENLKPEWIINFAYNDDSKYQDKCNTDSSIYKVLYVKDGKALICESNSFNTVRETYLIGTEGLKDVPKRMTKKQIEKELGYPIEIVEEEEYEIRFI